MERLKISIGKKWREAEGMQSRANSWTLGETDGRRDWEREVEKLVGPGNGVGSLGTPKPNGSKS